MKVEGFSSKADIVKARTDEQMHSSVLQDSRPVGYLPNDTLEVCAVTTSSQTIIQWKLSYRPARVFSEPRYLVDHYQSRDHAFNSSPDLGAWFWTLSVKKIEQNLEQGDGGDNRDWWLPSDDNKIDWLWLLHAP